MVSSAQRQHQRYKIEIDETSESLYKGKASIIEAKSFFQRLKAEGLIIEGSFDSEVWILKPNAHRQKLTIKFSLESVHTIVRTSKTTTAVNTLKCWALEKLILLEPVTVQQYVHILNKTMDLTNSFEEAALDSLIDHISNLESETAKERILRTTLNFLDYSDLPFREEYLIELRIIRNKFRLPRNVRTLPNYPDVLKFHLILEYFSKIWNDEEKFVYFPILLWWKITNIIPLRPAEFCDISRDCLYIKDEISYIKLPRKKQKGTHKKVEVIDSVAINTSTYKLIEEYISLTEEVGITETLIHYNATGSFLKKNPWNINRNPLVFHYDNLSVLLEKFYDEIIGIKFEITDLDRITPNDTRHFAFCNLMLQGMNALTIARLGGHRNIQSQYHYQQHMDYFTESKVFHLTKTIQLKKFSEFHEVVSNIELEQAKTNALRSKQSFDFLEEMDIGNCTDPNKNCESEYCQFCQKWWISLEELHANEMKLRDISELKKQQIKVRLETMERLRKDMDYDYKTNSFPPFEQELLTKESKLLNGDIHDLAKLQSYLEII